MRKVILFNMVSLDGFFEDSKAALDWHIVDAEFVAFAIRQLDSIGTILFGRITYQMMASYWPTEAAIQRDPVIARQMNQTPKIVFSTTLEAVPWENSTLVKQNPVAEVARLRQQPGKDMILFGSAKLAAVLARHGLIDEYRIVVNPIVLGSGHPLFPGVAARLPMKLLSTRVFGSGCVLLIYQPK